MPRTRGLLQRFRGAGAPGAASAVGVPADRVAETAAELEPVFARLAPVQAEAEPRAFQQRGGRDITAHLHAVFREDRRRAVDAGRAAPAVPA